MGTISLKPLSSFKYFINNKRRSFSMALAIAVSVLMILTFQIVFYAVTESGNLTFSGRMEHLTVVYPGDNGIVEQNVIDKVNRCSDVEKIIPFLVATTDYYHFFGNQNIPVYTLKKGDMEYAISKLGLKLVEGRLPGKGKNEILLDKRTAKNKGKKLGDFVGREVDKSERMSGKHKIVGILEGGCLIGFTQASAEGMDIKKGFLLFPKDGRLDSMNKLFKGIGSEGAQPMTKEDGVSMFKDDTEMMEFVYTIITAVIIFIMSFAAGNSSYAQYFSRRNEFATLQSIGYSRAQVLLRAAREITLLNAGGFLIGIVLTLIAAFLLKALIYDPNGYPFILMPIDGLVKAIVIPVCTTLFSLIPAWWTLSKVNQLEAIEKYE